jgi:hypothetical protein
MPVALADVRSWGWTGKHVLDLSLTGFDPKQTLGRIQNNSGPAQGLSRSGRDKLPFQ